MRAFAVAILAAGAIPAFGQTSLAELNIQNAFVTLRAEPEIMLELDGTDQYGARSNVLYSNAFFKYDPLNPDSFAKAEINEYVNGAHTHRIVGDGTTLWSYGFAQNTYSTFKYGSYSGAEPEGFRYSLLQELAAFSDGPNVYLARMLREIYGFNPAVTDKNPYTGWFPEANITLISKGSTPVLDPVDKTRTYSGDDYNYYLLYTYAIRPLRSGAFHFTRTDIGQPWTLKEIYYADLQYINPSTPRLVDWKITVYTGALPSSTNYVFVPPASARSIANVKGGG